jgi:hypothetical protein
MLPTISGTSWATPSVLRLNSSAPAPYSFFRDFLILASSPSIFCTSA